MDDMTTFERQLAAGFKGLMGPSQPVDDAAIFSAIATQPDRSRFQSMFNATRFVVAGVIVALFGGFLLIAQPFDQQEASVPGAAPSDAGSSTQADSLAGAFDSASATLLSDGRILFVAEGEPDGVRSSGEVWDPATATFSSAGSLAEARGGHTATLLRDGRVLVVGGGVFGEEVFVDDGPPQCPAGASVAHNEWCVDVAASAEIWDPATATFGLAGTPVQARIFHTATLLPDGRVLVIGSWTGSDEARATAEIWDPATGSFKAAGSAARARSGHTATLLPDGRVLVIGGTHGEGEATVAAEVWDPATASFRPAGSLATARGAHSATLLPDGRVLVVGGDDPAVGNVGGYASAEVWDPVTESFEPAGALAEGRWFPTATLLPDGRVLVTGGRGNPSGSAEIWDPATATFGPAGSLAELRYGSPVMLLPDGGVFVLGGEGVDSPLSSTEFWEVSDQ